MTHRILVTTDLGPEAGHALDHVLRLAQRRVGTEVHVLRVCHVGDELRARAELEEHVSSRVPRSSPLRPVTHVRVNPSVVAAIRDTAAELGADLIAVGSRGGSLLAGGTAESLLDAQTTSLLVVRSGHHGDDPVSRGPVLVGTDFSEPARRALELASALRGDAELGLVHVVETDPHRLPRVPRPEFEPALEPLRARLADWGGTLAQRVFVERGEIVATLASIAHREHASMVAVGAHGLRDLQGPVSTTAAARLVRAATVPILVVP